MGVEFYLEIWRGSKFKILKIKSCYWDMDLEFDVFVIVIFFDFILFFLLVVVFLNELYWVEKLMFS